MSTATYRIEQQGKAIRCLVCGRASFNTNDIQKLYCGACHCFHEPSEDNGPALMSDENEFYTYEGAPEEIAADVFRRYVQPIANGASEQMDPESLQTFCAVLIVRAIGCMVLNCGFDETDKVVKSLAERMVSMPDALRNPPHDKQEH
jgi:hypothetical protein